MRILPGRRWFELHSGRLGPPGHKRAGLMGNTLKLILLLLFGEWMLFVDAIDGIYLFVGGESSCMILFLR